MRQKDGELNGLLFGRWELFWQALRGGGPDWSRVRSTVSAANALFDTLVANLVNKIGAGYAWWLSNPPSQADTASHIAELQRQIAKGRKLLLVAHSQGSLFVNTAYDAVLPATSNDAMKVVHVGPASATARGPYTTGTIDVVIAGLLRLGTAGGVLPPNWTLPPTHLAVDASGHTFLSTYLSPSLTSAGKIEGDIRLKMDTLEDPPLDETRYERVVGSFRFLSPQGALAEPPGLTTNFRDCSTYIDGLWQMTAEDRQSALQVHAQGGYRFQAATRSGAYGTYLPSKKTSRWCGVKSVLQWGSSEDDLAHRSIQAPQSSAEFTAIFRSNPATVTGMPIRAATTLARFAGHGESQVVQATTAFYGGGCYMATFLQPEVASDGTPYERLLPDQWSGMAVVSIVVDKRK